jgi:hypothetical protein
LGSNGGEIVALDSPQQAIAFSKNVYDLATFNLRQKLPFIIRKAFRRFNRVFFQWRIVAKTTYQNSK